MAGRLLHRQLLERLQADANSYFEVDAVDVAIGTDQPADLLHYVCARVTSGASLKALSLELSASVGRPISYERLMRFLYDRYAVESVDSAIDAARVRASHVLADESLEIADAATPETAQVARVKVNQRNWLAERYNRKQYGQDKGASVNVQVNVASLHLEALQRIEASVVSQGEGAQGDSKSLPAGEVVQAVDGGQTDA